MKFLLVVVGLAISLQAAVYDITPSDYESAKPGIHVMSLNYLYKNLTGPYHKGAKLTDDSIKQHTAFWRYNYFLKVGDKPVSLGVVLPYTQLKTKGEILEQALGKESKGASDGIVSATIWLKSDRENKEYFALSLIATLPTGSYDANKPLNTADGRTIYALTLGYITKLQKNLFLELIPELAMYGDKKSAGNTLKQKPSVALSSHLRVSFLPELEGFIGFQSSYNSQTSMNGIKQNDEHFSQKYSTGFAWYTERYHQLLFRYSKEKGREFGMQSNNEFLLRYRWWF